MNGQAGLHQHTGRFLNGFSPVCNVAMSNGRVPQVSGLRVDFTCNGLTPVVTGLWKAPNWPSGPLTAIGSTDAIRLVINDFLAAGGDGYTVFVGIPGQVGNPLVNDAATFIRANSPVAPVIEGRIVKQ